MSNHEFEHHVGLLICPQQSWSKHDKEEILNLFKLKKKSEIYSELLFYNDFMLITPERKPHPEDCNVCLSTIEYFKQLQVNTDTIFYNNGPYLTDTDNKENYVYLKELISSLFQNEKIKKIHFLYLHSITDLGFTDLKTYKENFSFEIFSQALVNKTIFVKGFLDLCQNIDIESGIVYEITRDYSRQY